MTGLIERGTRARDAVKNAGLSSPWLLRQFLKNPTLRTRWTISKRISRRRQWPPEVIDEILTDIAASALSTRHAVTRRGLSYGAFIALVIRDKEIEARYLRAKELAWFRQADEIGSNAIKMADSGDRTARRFSNQAWNALRNTEPRMRRRRMAAACEARGQLGNAITEARRRVAKAKRLV